jgi:hypothetical protein
MTHLEEGLLNRVQAIQDRMSLFPALGCYSLVHPVEQWEKAVGQVVDGGVVDFINWSRISRQYPDKFTGTVEQLLAEGADRAIGLASADDLNGEMGRRIADALLASIELHNVQSQSEMIEIPDSVTEVITQRVDYSTTDPFDLSRVARKSIRIWQSVLEAIDRKAPGVDGKEWVWLGGRAVKVADAKRYVTAHVIKQLGIDWDQSEGRQHDNLNSVEVWRDNMFQHERVDYIHGAMVLVSAMADEPEHTDFTSPNTYEIPPERFAKPFIKLLNELDLKSPEGREMAINIVRKLVMGVVDHNHLLFLPKDTVDYVISRDIGLHIDDLLIRGELAPAYCDYIEGKFVDKSPRGKISDSEALAIVHLGRLLNPTDNREEAVFDRVYAFGSEHYHPLIKLQATRMLVGGENLVGLKSERLARKYNQMIREKLFSTDASSVSIDIRREIVKSSTMTKSAAWLMEAMVPKRIRLCGPMVLKLFVEQFGEEIHDALDDPAERENMLVLIKKVNSKRTQLEENGADLFDWNDLLEECRDNGLLDN